jgi:hypothetical protein
MKTDVEIKIQAFEILNRYLGMVESERFIALIQREKFDYTKWRETIFEDLTAEEISKKAMEFQQKLNNQVSSTVDSAPLVNSVLRTF